MSLMRGQLPVRLTPLVGRESELDDIVRALGHNRLITLTGPGGTGKTRLALAAARTAEASFSGGACWVALAQTDAPAIVGQAVATQLGVPDTPGQDPIEAIAKHVAEHPVLIVLDNCEHLAEAAAGLAEYLLAACPALVMLATSREALGVEGELSWQVPPLSLPEVRSAPTASALASYDAVKLFEQRAQLVRPSFRITDENAAAVLTICQRLDGLPLAIELAAARMRMLSAAQLAERMDDIFAVLVGGARSAPPRHQALRATLDWSYDLLDPDERATFRRLATFFGGFTLPAAERIAAGGDIRPDAMLELLTRLADKSLLRVEYARGGSRYFLLATIRDYARERLAEAAEYDQARQAHLQYFTKLVEDATARIEQVEAAAGRLEVELDRLDAELPNLRRAFEFAQESGDPVAPLRIAGPLDRYAYLRGRYHEVRQWMDEAVTSCPDAPAGLRAKALLGGGRLALLQCDYAPAVRRLEAALRLYRELDDPRGIASSLQVLGSVAREQGRYARAVELHAESLGIADAAGDRWAVASAHGYLAFASWLQRDFGRAAEEAGTALAKFRELGDVEGAAWSLISLGTVARYQGDAERASVLLTESLALSEGIGFREGIAWSVEQLGLLAAVDGDPVAISLLRRSLELHSELRDRWRMSSLLEDLAAIALAQGNAPHAARLLGAAEAIREAIGTVIAPCERLQHNQTTIAVRTALGDEAFDAALRQGQLASMDELTADLPSADPAEPSSGQAGPDQTRPDQTVPEQATPDEATKEQATSERARPDEATPEQAAPDQATSDEATPVQARPDPDEAASDQAGPDQLVPAPARPAKQKAARSRTGQSTGNGAVPSGMLRIRTLGGAVVEIGDTALTAADWSYAKPRELMFLLASSPPMTKDQIAGALWPDLSRQQLGNALHTALRELRRALGDAGWVQYSDGHYRFDRSRTHECDVTAFEDALVAARRARPAEAALPELQRAIAVYGGDFLDGMATGEWALVRRDELRRAFESALLATGRLLAAAGRHQAAAAAFRRAVAHEPLNESAHRELMNCWARLGETARAVRHYEELAGVLREQVGVAPAAETEALYRRLLAAQ
jgi:predicted ATPase/two-component SAPR family response regulator